ncbi:fructosamine kinase [Caldalkalibacillus thermarum]|uniref:fructosamine kinase family protein n=1 Tax=Caldalkalibacillus thermarum TaxID=296745 RepID=UPI0016668567|nr:fructosamine kinase family protein [Caldalkalibacillus thermarum]GGK14703.1 fructosamine kinase [Caldalkalibacillus thermarum]
MIHTVKAILHEMGDSSSLIEVQPVHGGDISQAFEVRTEQDHYFVKINRNAAPDIFQKEADGLQQLRQAGALSVPQVYHVSPAGADHGYIVMEWVPREPASDSEARLGRGLAQLHQYTHTRYGLAEDNYIGKLPQPNGWQTSWPRFLREKRLGYQAKLAEEKGRLPAPRKARLEKLLDRLEQWVPDHQQPVMLHGDLWSGNWLAGPNGEPYLIDPAVFYGDREFELAFTELFGGFSPRFYAAYRDVQPLSDYYEDVRPLYQLYYLLVHLNLFGESYGPAVDRILRHYVG